ncbi:hypothetical protein MKW98_006646 [Papaver atlanticum]|uniref:MULE transposase domain-containing protein n=1 Tax=Papaver atlanticum TaxID=357466 RepID=A0AAD4T2R0_9MAGN|nr:hypothetical protein MKW98_006646 [Papaver atlanticum]
MKRGLGISITEKQDLTGCKRGIKAVRGSPDQSYQHLVSYSNMLVEDNPRTKTAIETDTKGGFLYYFFTLGVSLHGFKSWCRPTFVVYDIHLTGERGGTLLSAIGYDANGKMYPIAFAIVDSENGDSCLWFMQKLFDALGHEYSMRNDLVVCSDRSASFESAIAEVFPSACHVYYAYHIKGNIIRRYHNFAAAKAFMRAAQAYTKDGYQRAMLEVKKDKVVFSYVQELHPRHWARVKAKRSRYTLTTNICESWNNLLLKARAIPITHLVDFILTELMGGLECRLAAVVLAGEVGLQVPNVGAVVNHPTATAPAPAPECEQG